MEGPDPGLLLLPDEEGREEVGRGQCLVAPQSRVPGRVVPGKCVGAGRRTRPVQQQQVPGVVRGTGRERETAVERWIRALASRIAIMS